MNRMVNQKRKKWWVKEQVSRKRRNWYQSEVDKEIKSVDSSDMVKHNERSDQSFLETMMSVAEQEQLGQLARTQLKLNVVLSVSEHEDKRLCDPVGLYLADYCTPVLSVASRRHLRSAHTRKFVVQRTRTTLGSPGTGQLSELFSASRPPSFIVDYRNVC